MGPGPWEWQPMPSMALGPAAEFGIPSRDSCLLLVFFIYVAQYQYGGKDAYGSIPTVARETKKK